MDPNLRQQIDMSHELLKGNLYPENHMFRRKIDEAFLITERPSKSEIDSVADNFNRSKHSLPFSILAIYESRFSIQADLDDEWLAEDVATMARHLLNYPKLAYVNSPFYDEPYLSAIFNFDDILKVDEYRSFWRDFSAGIKGNPGTALTEQKEQLKQEVELEQKLKQELIQSCGDYVRNMVNNATDKFFATFEGAKRQLQDDLRSIMLIDGLRRVLDRSSETQ